MAAYLPIRSFTWILELLCDDDTFETGEGRDNAEPFEVAVMRKEGWSLPILLNSSFCLFSFCIRSF